MIIDVSILPTKSSCIEHRSVTCTIAKFMAQASPSSWSLLELEILFAPPVQRHSFLGCVNGQTEPRIQDDCNVELYMWGMTKSSISAAWPSVKELMQGICTVQYVALLWYPRSLFWLPWASLHADLESLWGVFFSPSSKGRRNLE